MPHYFVVQTSAKTATALYSILTCMVMGYFAVQAVRDDQEKRRNKKAGK